MTVPASGRNQRLDKFLARSLNMPRSQIQKRIKSSAVLVNGQQPTVHQFLKEGDVITFKENKSAPAQVSAPAMERHKKTAQAETPALGIIAQTADYLVVNKPAGLLVHPVPEKKEMALTDLLLEKYPEIKKVGEDPVRPGIVHRLDREVSGVLAVAKNQSMFNHLKDQFKSRKTKKEYIALVYGAPQKPDGEIRFNIDRSDTVDHKMAAVPEHEDRGRAAITHFELLEKLGNYSLLRLMPATGRTHQIRVHLNAYGLPIVGDTIYKPKKLKQKIKLDRIFLHATTLGFYDLSGKWQEYEAPLPPALQSILENLK